MEDAYSRHADEGGIVDEIHHGIEGFVASHAAHVEVLLEVELLLVDSLAGLSAYGHERARFFALGSRGVFQLLQRGGGSQVAEYHGGVLALYALYLAHGCGALYPHRVAFLQRSADGGQGGGGRRVVFVLS